MPPGNLPGFFVTRECRVSSPILTLWPGDLHNSRLLNQDTIDTLLERFDANDDGDLTAGEVRKATKPARGGWGWGRLR